MNYELGRPERESELCNRENERMRGKGLRPEDVKGLTTKPVNLTTTRTTSSKVGKDDTKGADLC